MTPTLTPSSRDNKTAIKQGDPTSQIQQKHKTQINDLHKEGVRDKKKTKNKLTTYTSIPP